MAIDYTKSPDEIIVQLINDENNRSFTTSDLDLTNVAVAPDPVSGRQPFNNVRTAVRVAAVPGSGYTNEVNVKYNRIHLRTVFPNSDSDDVRYATTTDAYQLNDRVNLSDILADINAKYGINILAQDIFDVPLPTFDGPPPEGGWPAKYVRLEMVAGSKVFVGGINIQILPNDYDLSNMQTTELNGLYYPSYDVPDSWTNVHNLVNVMATPGYFG
jgi:hypothetical protein